METEQKEPRRQREPMWVQRFIAALSNSGNVRAACVAAGISHAEVYKRRIRHPAFAKRWDEAYEQSTQLLEAEMWRRAMSQSDTLLIFALKARRPEIYRERLEHTGAGGGPIRVSAIDDAELERRITAELDRRVTRGSTNGVHPLAIEGPKGTSAL